MAGTYVIFLSFLRNTGHLNWCFSQAPCYPYAVSLYSLQCPLLAAWPILSMTPYTAQSKFIPSYRCGSTLRLGCFRQELYQHSAAENSHITLVDRHPADIWPNALAPHFALEGNGLKTTAGCPVMFGVRGRGPLRWQAAGLAALSGASCRPGASEREA